MKLQITCSQARLTQTCCCIVLIPFYKKHHFQSTQSS